MPGYHARGGRHAPRIAAARRTATDESDIARGLQSRCRGWIVMWSKWRRTYTAFSCITSAPMIIDEADFDRFLDRIRQVERARAAGMAGAGIG